MQFSHSRFDFSIVALAGYAGSGKTTASNYFIDRGYHVLSFATPIKTVLSLVYDVPLEHFINPELKAQPHINLNGKTPRQAMQLIGTEGFRNLIDVYTWTKHLERSADKYMRQNPTCSGICIDDLRFDSEYEMLRHHNATILYIEVPDQLKPFNHQSENELEAMRGKADGLIINDMSSVKKLHNTISDTLHFLKGK